MNKKTTTNLNKEPSTCQFPRCGRILSRFGLKDQLCDIHSRGSYPETFKEWQRLKKEKGYEKESRKTLSTASGPRLILGKSEAFPPYKVVVRNGERYIVGNPSPKNKIIKKLNDGLIIEKLASRRVITRDLAEEPDLFIRFAELPETEEAYIDFISQYGLPGLGRKDAECLTDPLGDTRLSVVPFVDFEYNEESFRLILAFHRHFKAAFGFVEIYIKEDDPTEYASDSALNNHLIGLWLKKYFEGFMKLHTKTSPWDFSGRIVLEATDLIGVLVLQLYRYLLIGKPLRVCFNPECRNLTTRTKFCSEEHQRQFERWKRNGTIIFIDGKPQHVPKKRGRPEFVKQSETAPLFN